MTEMSVGRLEECLRSVIFTRRAADNAPSDSAVARRIGWPTQKVTAWRAGTEPVPGKVAAWLERRAAARAADPVPVLPDFRQLASRSRTLPSEEEAQARSMLLRTSMNALGWKNVRLASKIGRSEESVSRFLRGRPEQAAPLDLLSWLEQVRVKGEDRAGPPPSLAQPASEASLNAPEYGRRLVAAMTALDMGVAYLAKQVDRTFEGVRQWTLGKVPVPGDLLAWLERTVASDAADPPPAFKAVAEPSKMTTHRLIEILDALQISSRELSARVPYLSNDGKDVRRWRGGKVAIPKDIADWLERVWDARLDDEALAEVWTNPPRKGEDFWAGPPDPVMHPEELDRVMKALGFNSRILQAAVSWLEEGEVDRWLGNIEPVEPNVARWLRALYKADGDDRETGKLMRRRPPTPMPGLERLSDRQNAQINGNFPPQEENDSDPKRPMTLDEIL